MNQPSEKAVFSPFILVAAPPAATPSADAAAARPIALPLPRAPGQKPRHEKPLRVTALPPPEQRRQFSRHTSEFTTETTLPSPTVASAPRPSVPATAPVPAFRPGLYQSQPRAAEPKTSPISTTPEAAEIRIGKKDLTFCCRQCRHSVTVLRKLAGQKLRCPKCHSAIRAASACGRSRGANLQHDVESMLHPQRFLFPSQMIQSPLSQMKPVLFAGAAMATLGTSAWATAKLALENGEAQAAPVMVRAAETSDPFVLRSQAEATVRGYLLADGWQSKAAFVREPERVAPLMESYFSHFGGSRSAAISSVRAAAPGFYSDMDLPQQVSRVRAELADGSSKVFFVEHLPQGPRIEWESSTGWSGLTWEQVLQNGGEETTLRVLASRDDYFSGGNEEGSHLCLMLADPRTGDRLGYAYMDLDAPDAAALKASVAGTSASAPVPLTLGVRPGEDATASRSVQITRFVKPGFRTFSSNSALADR